MRSHVLRATAPLLALAAAAAPLAAQGPHPESVRDWLENCRSNGDRWSSRRGLSCEVRAMALPRGTRALTVDGKQNGGVRITAWDRDSVAVFALVQAFGDDDTEAQAVARTIRISTAGARIEAEGARDLGRREGWAVSYHIFTPRRMDVDASTLNGGIGVDGLRGRIEVEAVNGGLTMRDVGGDVRGRTRNGGINLALTGDRWDGRGVALETTNGGVRVTIPERYNARLETATVNGGFDIDFPITLQGRIGRNISTTLGDGGPLVRVTTTNGGVRITRR